LEDDDEKRHQFFGAKNWVTPSVAAPGDINLSDATKSPYIVTNVPYAESLSLRTDCMNMIT